jgi:cytidylate kinase
MGMLASQVSAIPVVRRRLTQMQQVIGHQGRIVAEGRDTGTVVFPDACWKFYLEADPEERARRRAAQLQAAGQKVDVREILAMIVKRDHDDQERALAPLRKAKDAVVIDTTGITIQEVCDRILATVKEGL